MEKFKGTKKPWRIADDAPAFSAVASDTYHHISAGGGYHNEEKNKGFGISGFMSIHDANLISAAPDLLEALQCLAEFNRSIGMPLRDYPLDHPIGKAHEAIKKALGEKQ